MTNSEDIDATAIDSAEEDAQWTQTKPADKAVPTPVPDEDIPVDEEVSVATVETLLAASEEDQEEVDDDSEDGQDEVEESDITYEDPLDKLFFVKLKKNVRRGGGKLRVHLPAPVLFRITRSAKEYIVDWSSEELSVSCDTELVPACTIEISEQDLLDIAAGGLNPQVAMLSDKVRIEGKIEMAIYAFNLFVRKSSR